MKAVYSLAIFLCWVLASSVSHGARYYTWVDENGEVRHTLVSDPEDAATEKKQPVKNPTMESEITDTSHSGEQQQTELKDRQQGSSGGVSDEVVVDNTETVSQEVGKQNQIDGANKEPDVEVSPVGHDSADKTEPRSSTVIEFDGEEYIDAAELERQGFVKPKEQRFYTVIDSDGRYRNIPYPENAEISGGASVQLTEPQKFQIVAKEQAFRADNASSHADPEALAMLGIEADDQKELAILSEHCCEELKTFDNVELDMGEGNLLEINEKDYSFDFGIGNSLVRVIKLPESEGIQTLRIRTYAGPKIFYPSVLILNEEYRPQRFLQDLVYVYEPENWFRYGYLEGYFKVDPSKSRFLVIFTTQKDERKRTVVEGIEERAIILNHGRQGILHLSRIEVSGSL